MKIVLRTQGLKQRALQALLHQSAFVAVALALHCALWYLLVFGALEALLTHVWSTRRWRTYLGNTIHTVATTRRQRNLAQMGRELTQLTRQQRDKINPRVLDALDREIENATLVR